MGVMHAGQIIVLTRVGDLSEDSINVLKVSELRHLEEYQYQTPISQLKKLSG